MKIVKMINMKITPTYLLQFHTVKEDKFHFCFSQRLFGNKTSGRRTPPLPTTFNCTWLILEFFKKINFKMEKEKHTF